MAKGDDALSRKKNRAQRKKARSMNTKASVSARVASIIAAKRRRKTGKRRVCEGMCFTLPTPEDPFNDRNDPAAQKEKLLQKAGQPQQLSRGKKDANFNSNPRAPLEAGKVNADPEERVSKYLILCLKAIEEGTSLNPGSAMFACKWGIDCWRSLSSGSDVVDPSGKCASAEQIAWLASIASDTIAKREKEGLLVPSPFLVFLVPSQDRASEARSLCRPLKELGVHTVSLHPGASLDHQVRGLKSCEPEFIVSTPDRLLALVSAAALDISNVSLLVVDGLERLVSSGYADDIRSIRDRISGDPRILVFGGDPSSNEASLLPLIKHPARLLTTSV